MFKKMRANDTWNLPGNGRLLVTGNPGIGRYIFGVPWLLFGVHFLYKYLILGIAEYIKAGDIAGIFTGAFGWLVVLFMGAIFVVPGWLMVFLRRRVIIDTVYGKVEEKNDFLLFSRGKIHHLADFGAILLVATHSSGKVTTSMHEVRLMPRADREYILVGVMQDNEEARRLGQALADLLRLPCREQGEEPEEEGEEEVA